MGKPSIRSVLRAITLHATATNTTPAAIAQALILGQFTSTVQNGRTVISTSEAGGSTTFAIPEGLSAAQLMDIGSRALDWIESRPNPAIPGLPRLTRRLRFCFDGARI